MYIVIQNILQAYQNEFSNPVHILLKLPEWKEKDTQEVTNIGTGASPSNEGKSL